MRGDHGRWLGERDAFAVDLGKYGQLKLVRETPTAFALIRKYRPTSDKHFTKTERLALPSDTLLAAFRAADTVIDKRFRGSAMWKPPIEGRGLAPPLPTKSAPCLAPCLHSVARHRIVPVALGVVAAAAGLGGPDGVSEEAGRPPLPNRRADCRDDQR